MMHDFIQPDNGSKDVFVHKPVRCSSGNNGKTQFRSPARGDMVGRRAQGACAASEHVQRKVTAILVADVAGYSRLAGGDEIFVKVPAASITTRTCEGRWI